MGTELYESEQELEQQMMIQLGHTGRHSLFNEQFVALSLSWKPVSLVLQGNGP